MKQWLAVTPPRHTIEDCMVQQRRSPARSSLYTEIPAAGGRAAAAGVTIIFNDR